MPFKSPKPFLVFIVDEEYFVASCLAQFLCQEGFDARSFAGAKDAVDAARLEPPDFLVADIVIPPDLNSGIELATAIRELSPACKVLLFASHAEANDILEFSRKAGHEFTLLQGPVYLVNLLEGFLSLVHDNRSTP